MKEFKQDNNAKSLTFYFNKKKKFSLIGKKHIEFLCKMVRKRRQSCRICLHNDSEDTLHNMIIAHPKNIYIRPHKNPYNAKAYHIIKGAMRIIGIEDNGNKIFDLVINKKHKVLRLEPNVYLLLIPKTNIVVFQEIALGPFRREGENSQVYAPFSPEDTNQIAVKHFITKYTKEKNAR
ncbi:WbuC family cupin fold metalloprotein [Helicobacter valdiviensis]|nr:WbuC family cupin fold metalloprotein [Helicobacter valdiviensis]